jgi:methylase of polypeptide subunit release factors
MQNDLSSELRKRGISASITKKLAAEILAIGREAHTEEDVRLNVEHALKPVLSQLGISTVARYEQRVTLLQGSRRADAVYGFGVIEYERPGKIATPAGRKEVVKQLAEHLTGKAREIAPTKPIETVKKMIGIGIDGREVMYLRYASSENRARFFQPVSLETQLEFFKQPGFRRGGFQIVGPMPINEASVDWLLYSLQFFHRRALEPHGLAEVFGPETDIASGTINALYHRLLTTENPRVEMFFAQWDMIFGVVYGQELERGDIAAKELAKLYRIDDQPDLKKLLFAIHTYYVLLMKLLAAELISLQEGSWFSSFAAEIEAATDATIHDKIDYLENGGLFAQFKIVNFLEGDFFRWYLDVWDADLARDIRHIAIALQQFEPATATIDPDATRDLLKKLYQYLLPRRVRHDLGEYYTPDWLAERLIRQLGYDGNPDKRVLDPSCGSGTFLALCLRKAFDYADRYLIRPDELVAKLLTNITGFDLNPLAVIAARTNFLLGLGTLIRHAPRIEIPVYFCDSIITPSEYTEELFAHAKVSDRRVDTAKGTFSFPGEVIEREKIETVCALVEESVQIKRTGEQFLAKVHEKMSDLSSHAEKLLAEIFEKIDSLNRDRENGIWARFLKNQFAPVFVGNQTFDFVLGNPPWVNWQNLSDSYRDKTWRLWEDYGLFSLTGHAARLGGGKKDLAMLFTYVCLDNYVKPAGRLGFIITQTLFKTKGAGGGFRRFRLGNRQHFKVLQVDDLSRLKPFEGATNLTAVVTFQKGKRTTYPVPYSYWNKKPKAPVAIGDELEEILDKTLVSQWIADPVSEKDSTSSWLTARPKAVAALRKAIGESRYRAYEGANTGGLSGAYWVEILRIPTGRSSDGVLVSNLFNDGKTKVKRVEMQIEADLLYPLARGRDVGRWFGRPSAHIVLAQNPATRTGFDEGWMKANLTKTYQYLQEFETDLRTKRRSKPIRDLMEKGAFYSMYGIADYTLCPFKVCWPELSNDLRAAVVGPLTDSKIDNVIVVPDHTVVFIPLRSGDEAHYCCGVLNSGISNLIVRSYVTMHPSPHVLENIRVPQYDPNDKTHLILRDLSQRAHELATERSESSRKKLQKIDADVDQLAAKIWNITEAELKDIQFSLADLR